MNFKKSVKFSTKEVVQRHPGRQQLLHKIKTAKARLSGGMLT
jgi:hypothetical protein